MGSSLDALRAAELIAHVFAEAGGRELLVCVRARSGSSQVMLAREANYAGATAHALTFVNNRTALALGGQNEVDGAICLYEGSEVIGAMAVIDRSLRANDTELRGLALRVAATLSYGPPVDYQPDHTTTVPAFNGD